VKDAGWRHSEKDIKNEIKLFDNVQKDKFVIYLKHQPRIPKAIKGKFDLMLSGHTHNGQIFPGVFLVEQTYDYVSGLYDLNNNSYVYVNNGAGTWGPPIRFLSFPQISLIDLSYDTLNIAQTNIK
jgi:hypothetical protein